MCYLLTNFLLAESVKAKSAQGRKFDLTSIERSIGKQKRGSWHGNKKMVLEIKICTCKLFLVNKN